ncbi:helix-turn-helix domain-containing protein [Cryptosporangium phraense]|uniref:Helix-turn-helix domain-containing protein n=1 Tax=Cryptosporangium phraense TaxID=2593070 RepID=A0A545ASP9_9ACTN|nr:helix-turn-helix transcriptional regulator [Cryptosporangium phraense]TQS44323.1 helix-turn-helix domain-containing protein [Cryptosporangium phraense]
MSPQPQTPRWLPLGTELKKLRTLAGLSHREVAERTGLSNARVSRVETGRSLLSLPEIEQWAKAVGADEAAREVLRKLANEAHSATVENFSLDRADEQEKGYAEIEASARLLVSITRGVPGLLQTADYMAAITRLADDTDTRDIPRSVATRTERSAILFKGDKEFRLMASEADLREPVLGPRGMAAQYDRISQLSQLEGVNVGILPLGGAPAGLLISDANLLLDRSDGEPSLVQLEHSFGEAWVSDPETVARYVALAERVWASALTGDDARALLARLAREALAAE